MSENQIVNILSKIEEHMMEIRYSLSFMEEILAELKNKLLDEVLDKVADELENLEDISNSLADIRDILEEKFKNDNKNVDNENEEEDVKE
jgi:hypothetical protein